MNDWTPPARPALREHLAALALIVPLTLFAHLPHIWFVRVQRNLDFDAHYRWAMEAAAAMAAGDPWPRWMAAANQGLGEPALLFADEPTGSLDSLSSETVLELMLELVREAGTTVVMITHDPRTAAYADREVIVRDGMIGADQWVAA